ncbi:MAG: hypothetical protein WCI88_04290 [Chloroflexota bacterium]|jgi:acetyl-CoA acetyltransferase
MSKSPQAFPHQVAIVGAGMSKFGSFPEKNSRDLFIDAFQSMRSSIDKGLDPRDIEALYLGNFSSDVFEGQAHTAAVMADVAGLTPCPAIRVEDACASGGVALRQGVLAIAYGIYEIVLVSGVEKMSNLPTDKVTNALAAAGDISYEIPSGFTFPGFYAAMTSVYMHKYKLQTEDLMRVAIKNHQNGSLNPKAHLGITILDMMNKRIDSAKKKGKPIPLWENEWDFLRDDQANPMVAWPLRLFDCSPITDGSASILLVSGEIAKQFTDNPVFIIGSGQASDCPLHDRSDLSKIRATSKAAQIAYETAGVSANDIQIAEVHDCFTIAEIQATEDLGFFEQGTGYKMVEEGVTTRDGRKPINTSGGLKSKGHPVGASGVAQAVEIWEQMRSEAGARQVTRDIPLALTHNVGGTGQTCVIHIFERRY